MAIDQTRNNLVGRRSFLAAVATAGSAAAAGAEVFDVRHYGAQGGRDTVATAQLQAALDACSRAGGGTVYVPSGEYLSGGLFLPSRVSLYLETGSTIHASTRQEDYPNGPPRLINARKAENISILGPGTLNGQGIKDLGRRPGFADEPRPKFRTGVMLLDECRQVILRDFTILYSDGWACHLLTCEKVVVDGVTILNNYFHTNSDGIDPDSCRDVRISNCHITAGDDCICLKTHDGIPCEDVVVTNCTTESIATANPRKRFSSHYEMLASYTWSHAIDDSTDLQSTLTPQDSYYPALDRSNSLFDQRHRFVFSGVYQTGKIAGRGFAGKFASDWSFAPLVQIASGRPFNIITAGGDNLQLESFTSRPSIVGRRGRQRTIAVIRRSPPSFLPPDSSRSPAGELCSQFGDRDEFPLRQPPFPGRQSWPQLGDIALERFRRSAGLPADLSRRAHQYGPDRRHVQHRQQEQHSCRESVLHQRRTSDCCL